MRLFGKRSSQADASGGSVSATIHMGAHDLRLPDVTLHYQTWGQPTTPERAVVLIHGLTASQMEFAEMGPALALEGWYAIALDLRGRGLSSKPAHGYNIAFHAADVLALCDALNLDTANIVGHSLGAVIGMYLAAIAPQRVRKLVLIDAGGNIPAGHGAGHLRLGLAAGNRLSLARRLPWPDEQTPGIHLERPVGAILPL